VLILPNQPFFKFNRNGILQWSTSYSTQFSFPINNLSLTSDGNFVVCGNDTAKGTNMFIMKGTYPLLQLVSPSGGELWNAGGQFDIKWNCKNTGNISLEYSTDNGVNWHLIESNLSPIAGLYKWNVPSTIDSTSHFKVRVSSTSSPSINYESDALKMIKGMLAVQVEQNSFSSQVNNDHSITLFWHTVTEVNNYGFEVERTAPLNLPQGKTSETPLPLGKGLGDGQWDGLWEKIGFVEGSGNSNSPKVYSFVDENPPAGNLQYRLKQIDTDGAFKYYATIAKVNYNLTGVEEKQLPAEFSLEQNYPNPFNPNTVISYRLPVSGHVELKVYDILGNEVASLVNKEQTAGYYQVKLDANNTNGAGRVLSSGMYIYKLTAGSFTSAKKLLLMK
jgi:hypothetical protein